MPYEEQIAELAAKLKERACAAGITAATAESCTGGLIAGAVTAVPGSSAFFYGGIVSYDNSVKQNVLGVPAEVLSTVGAVSSECAAAMADPTGAEPGKPVGTVWFGLSAKDGTRTEMCRFDGDRGDVRAQTVVHALELLLGAVAGHR